jgi:hypothetical protein
VQERGPGFGAQTFTVMFEAEPGFSFHVAQDWEVTPTESNHADRSLLVKNSQFQCPGIRASIASTAPMLLHDVHDSFGRR